MLKRKSIVLSDPDRGTNEKAVLTLQEDKTGLLGVLRLYNFSRELLGVSSLGLYANKKVYKAGLTTKSRMLYEFFISLDEIPNKFSCAVVNFQNAIATPILYGSSENSSDEIYMNIINEIANDNSMENTKMVLDNYGVDFVEEEKKEIEREIDKQMCQECQDCANCIYKKHFFENNVSEQATEVFSQQKEETSLTEEPEEISFLGSLRPQIDKLFADNPVDENLQQIIPSSKWARVDYGDEGDFYVFGLLYDESGEVKYVCYGVPAVYEEELPKSLSGYPIWLPLNQDKKEGFGYWLTYQDAVTGQPVKAILD